MLCFANVNWKKSTAVMFATRAPLLKVLDAAIETYQKNSSWTNVKAVVRAYRAWDNTGINMRRNRKFAVGDLEEQVEVVEKILAIKPAIDMEQVPFRDIFFALKFPDPMRSRSLQAALDSFPYSSAVLHAGILQALVDAHPATCYLSVRSVTRTETPPPDNGVVGWKAGVTHNDANTAAIYTSAKMNIVAEVYAIYPKESSKHQLGFVQHCTAKSDVSTFSDGSQVRDQTTVSFPVGDAVKNATEPWYFQGTAAGLTHPTWQKLKGTATASRLIKLEMSDNFVQNIHPFYGFSATGRTAATLKSIARTQSFICYVVHKNPAGKYLPIARKGYTIDVSMRVSSKTSQPKVLQSSATKDSVAKLVVGAELPAVSSLFMNGQSRWEFAPPNSTAFVPVTW